MNALRPFAPATLAAGVFAAGCSSGTLPRISAESGTPASVAGFDGSDEGGGNVASSGSSGSSGGSGSSGSGGGGSGNSSGSGSGGSGGAPGAGPGVDAGDAGFPPSEGGVLLGDAGASLVSLFDGTSFNGWIQVPPFSWSIVNGAMHSLGTARGFMHTANSYGDFRLVFSSRLLPTVGNPPPHEACVLFWGTSLTADAMAGIQVQPPKGYMWDYRRTGPTANKDPQMFETKFAHPNINSAIWSQCEMLVNQAAGMMRVACCQLTTTTPCKGVEIVDFKDPTAGHASPIALQVHNAGMIEEFKDLFVESPVADPLKLVTPQW